MGGEGVWWARGLAGGGARVGRPGGEHVRTPALQGSAKQASDELEEKEPEEHAQAQWVVEVERGNALCGQLVACKEQEWVGEGD